MDDYIDKKVVNMFDDKSKKLANKEFLAADLFEGFHFERMEKDSNGNSFIAENLVKYSQDCNYVVSVMKKNGSKTYLYNYEVPSKRLLEFMAKFITNKNIGEIIEIDRYMTETIV